MNMADIELVIKIPTGLYKLIRHKLDFYGDLKQKDIKTLMLAVDDGTLLPKGHGRLKDIDWIDDNCGHHYSDTDGSWCYAWKDIDNAQTIIEADTAESEDKE